MPLDQLANIAEIVAAALVIVSLIYVGVQIRQNTAATHAATGQAWFNTFDGHVGLINSSPTLADILHRGATGLSNIKDSEIIQFGAYLDQSFTSFEIFYFQRKAGTLGARLWSIQRQAIAALLMQPGQQQWWETRRHWYDKEFQEFVNQVIDSGEGKPMHPFSVEPSAAT
jgi:hypothetical protein